MRVIVHGATGAMGRELLRLSDAHYEGSELAAAVSPEGGTGITLTMGEVSAAADVILDFSFHTAIFDVAAYARAHKLPLVVGTTGHDAEEKQAIFDAAREIPVFYTGNMSVGIAVLVKLAKQAAAAFPDADIEIVETHHNRKVDAPSGTALMIADAAAESCGHDTEYVFERHSVRQPRDKKEIGISAVRGGTIVGEHEIIFAGHDEVMEIKHTALSREIFAQGAVEAAKFMASVQAPGLYDMSMLVQ